MNTPSSQQFLTLYKSSAGSGKTYTLAREYVRLALRDERYFRTILAVTFTNKATREMKERILKFLQALSLGNDAPLAEYLCRELDLTSEALRDRAQRVLSHILHDYSQFSVSTIDSFFQKVLRAFAREMGLHSGLQIELDQSKVLNEVIDLVISDVGKNQALTDWLVDFAREKIRDNKAWNVRNDIAKLSKELFNEQYKTIEREWQYLGAEFVKELRAQLMSRKAVFENTLQKIGAQAMGALESSRFSFVDLSNGPTGAISFLFKISQRNFSEPGKRALTGYHDVETWVRKSDKKKDEILAFINESILSHHQQALDYYDMHSPGYHTVLAVLQNLFTLGIFSDLTTKLAHYKDDNDLMLLSDATLFLKEIIGENEAPFVYEKTGNKFSHFLLDEFQDTSGFQWDNFRPLVINSLAEGNDNLVVGDVKQSIYRWRGGDWKLLLQQIAEDVGPGLVKEQSLQVNWRSAQKVIEFNNDFFASTSEMLKNYYQTTPIAGKDPGPFLQKEAEKITQAYQEVRQEVPEKKAALSEGFVQISLLPGSVEEDEEYHYKEEVLCRLPALVEELQDRGYKASDIAFLVRTQREGAAVVRCFLEYKNSPEAREGYSYEVISQEALLLSQAPIITFLISGFQYLNSPEPLAAAQLAHDWQRYILKENPADLHALFMAAGSGDVRAFLPQEFYAQLAFLQRLPVHELCEELLRLFRLEHSQDEFVWIQAFQDAILEFSESNTSSLSSFLAWWTETGSHRSVKISEQTNAMGVYTIHKSKGLQFKVVIIPYCDWSLQPDAQKSPTLWARTDQLPETGYTQGNFKGFAPVPIKFTSALNATHFAEYYQRELIMNAMDNFNLLYVAFTRAEDALYVFGKHEKPNKDGQFTYKSVSTLVGKWLVESQGIKETDEGLFYSVGKHPKGATQEAEPLGILTNQRYHTYPWRNRLAIKPRSLKVFEGEGEQARSRVNYGILVHDLLARVLHKDHLKPTLAEVIAEGLVSEQEAEKIRQQINHLFKEHALIRSWFSGDWEVRTEAPVLPQSGEIHRLDRVMIRGKHAVLVDFKTGKEDKKNVHQVLEYARLLTEMGYAPVEGYLLYLEESKIEKVIG